MRDLKFFDSTLRDGSHAVAHQLGAHDIEGYCLEADSAGLEVIIVGHGNGLGASSLQVGLSALTDQQMLTAARQHLKKTKLGAFLIPGFGTIRDDLGPALDAGVDVVCIASHCTEADITRQHIAYVTDRGREPYGVLLMYHLAEKETLLQEASKMQEYGARGVILMDSAGASVPRMVAESVRYLADGLSIPVGFHAHNNLGLAVANSLVAIESGASIVDGTVRGFGAGAGNCPLEVLAALLYKLEIRTGLNLYRLMDISDGQVVRMQKRPQQIDSTSIVSGLAGVFSGFAGHVQRAAKRFGVEPRDIFLELGKRRVVAGQEDYIVDIAIGLASKKTKENELSF